MQNKTCTGCGNTYPATTEYFNRKGRSDDVLRPKCKACEKSYREANKERKAAVDRQWRIDNREHKAEYMRHYYRANRERELARYYRWKDEHLDDVKVYWRAYTVSHKDKKREYDKVYRTTYFEKISAGKREWAESHRDMVRLNGRAGAARRKTRTINAEGKYTRQDVIAQYNRQKGKCYYCGKKVGGKFHVDHVVPLSRGGSNNPDNLVVACPSCNVRKNSRMPHEWAEGGRLL